MVKETSDKILAVIQITVLTVQSEMQQLLNKLRVDFDENFKMALQ